MPDDCQGGRHTAAPLLGQSYRLVLCDIYQQSLAVLMELIYFLSYFLLTGPSAVAL